MRCANGLGRGMELRLRVIAIALGVAASVVRAEGPAKTTATTATTATTTKVAPIASFADLLASFGKISGMTARYSEEKRIALLKKPLQSEGRIAFAAPRSLLRQVERPEPSTMLLEGEL